METIRLLLGKLRSEMDRCRKYLIPLGIMSAIYLFGISAILRANFIYIDDFQRIYGGWSGWDACSRYLSNFIATILHADPFLSDVSPLPQVFACILLAAASVCVLRLVTGRSRFTFWEYAAVIPLGLNPYMLECLSFRYDAPYMALSVLASVAPLLAMESRWWVLSLSTALGALVMCNTYQAASGILPMLTVLLAFVMWQRGRSWREILRFVASAAAGYCAGMLFYKFFIMGPPQVDYASADLPSADAFFPTVINNYKTFYSRILSDFDRKWLILIALSGAAFLWTALWDCRRSRIKSLLLAAAVMVLLAALTFGVYPFMSWPLIRPRTMYGLGATLAFLAVYTAASRKMPPVKVVCLALSWCFFVFTFTYGNALYVQKTYTEFRVEEVIDGLKATDSDLFTSSDTVMLDMNGSIGYAPALRATVDQFPMLRRLVPATLDEYAWMSQYSFATYYGLPPMTWTTGTDVDLSTFGLPLLDDTLYHTIYGNDHFLLIELK